MPAMNLLRFFDRHGMLAAGPKLSWRTVSGGAVNYVDKILLPFRQAGSLRLAMPVQQVERYDDGVVIRSASATEHFDHVVIATHSDQALEMLARPTPAEKEVLGAIKYQRNAVIVHTDTRVMPRSRRAWAAWNYHRSASSVDRSTVTYFLNRLQSLRGVPPLFASLNRETEIDESKKLWSGEYSHPVMDGQAIAAQSRWKEVAVHRKTSFCGAYWGAGFHEDGLKSAVRVCEALGVRW
jgi:predicted NAD/FAD-binding protein